LHLLSWNPDIPLLPAPPEPSRKALVIACGALVRELQAVIAANHVAHLDIRAVPASYHNRPERIAPGVKRLLDRARGRYQHIFVAYADCGTGGALDRLLAAEGIERLPGAHCYAFYSGVDAFARIGEADMRAFYLTDFLVRQFDALVIRGLGLDRHPELRDAYFGHYERVVYLSQAPTSELIAAASRAADRLGLAFEHRSVGYGDLAGGLARFAEASKAR
jgi:Protein of unknown function (DUF1638)